MESTDLTHQQSTEYNASRLDNHPLQRSHWPPLQCLLFTCRCNLHLCLLPDNEPLKQAAIIVSTTMCTESARESVANAVVDSISNAVEGASLEHPHPILRQPVSLSFKQPQFPPTCHVVFPFSPLSTVNKMDGKVQQFAILTFIIQPDYRSLSRTADADTTSEASSISKWVFPLCL